MTSVILALLAGCFPSLVVFFWLRGYLNKERTQYKKNCNHMLVSGLLTVLPVMLISGSISVMLNLSGVKTAQPLLYAALHIFLVFALSEELSKFYMFRRRLGKIEGEQSWLALIALPLAVLDLVIIIVLIIFICRHKNNPEYAGPLEKKSAL